RPAPAPGAEQRRKTVADMFPERLVERVEASCAVLFAKRVHFLQQIGMRTDRALPEHDQVAGQNIGALDRDADRHGTVEAAEVILRAVDDSLAAMDIHGVV